MCLLSPERSVKCRETRATQEDVSSTTWMLGNGFEFFTPLPLLNPPFSYMPFASIHFLCFLVWPLTLSRAVLVTVGLELSNGVCYASQYVLKWTQQPWDPFMVYILLRSRVDGDVRKGILRPFQPALPSVLPIVVPAGCLLGSHPRLLPFSGCPCLRGPQVSSRPVHAQLWISAPPLANSDWTESRMDKKCPGKFCWKLFLKFFILKENIIIPPKLLSLMTEPSSVWEP